MNIHNTYLLCLVVQYVHDCVCLPSSKRGYIYIFSLRMDVLQIFNECTTWAHFPPPSVDPRKTCDMLCRTYQGKHVLDVCFSNADKLCSRSRRFLAGYRYLSVMWVLCQYSMNRRWYSAYHAVVSYCMNMYNRIFFSHRIRMRFNVFWSGHESAHVYTGRTRPRPGHRAGPLRVRLS